MKFNITETSDFGKCAQLFKQIFDSIACQTGNAKIQTIKSIYEDRTVNLTLILSRYLSPYAVTHLGDKSLHSEVQKTDKVVKYFYDLEDELFKAKAMSNELIALVQNSLNQIEDDDVRKFTEQYFTRTYKLGITADGINKAFGEILIPTFNCMLAKKYFEHPNVIIGKDIFVTEKLDGIRCVAMVDRIINLTNDGSRNVKLYSRQGQEITGLCDVEQSISDIFKDVDLKENVFLDGELLVSDRDNIPSKEQYKRTTKIVRTKDSIKTGITYNVFDIVDSKCFVSGEKSLPYRDRRKQLESLLKDKETNSVKLVPVKEIFNMSDAERCARHVEALAVKARRRGEEGVMLNLGDASYECKRTSNLLKVKVFQDCDLKIVGFQEGTGKFEGTLGSLIVDYKGNQLGVGSGLSDEMRNEFWNNQDQYLGRVVSVQYFEETNDANGNKSLRFPVFIELREENKEVSYD